MYIVPVLQAAAQQGGIISMVLPIALIFVIFYLAIISFDMSTLLILVLVIVLVVKPQILLYQFFFSLS